MNMARMAAGGARGVAGAVGGAAGMACLLYTSHRYSILHGINGNTRYKLYFRNDDTGTVYSCYISGILYLTKYTLSPILKEGKEIEVYFHQNLAKADGNSLFISKYLFFVY